MSYNINYTLYDNNNNKLVSTTDKDIKLTLKSKISTEYDINVEYTQNTINVLDSQPKFSKITLNVTIISDIDKTSLDKLKSILNHKSYKLEYKRGDYKYFTNLILRKVAKKEAISGGWYNYEVEFLQTSAWYKSSNFEFATTDSTQWSSRIVTKFNNHSTLNGEIEWVITNNKKDDVFALTYFEGDLNNNNGLIVKCKNSDKIVIKTNKTYVNVVEGDIELLNTYDFQMGAVIKKDISIKDRPLFLKPQQETELKLWTKVGSHKIIMREYYDFV